MHFISAVRECDTAFADWEKQEDEVDEVSFSPAYTQLSATLYFRLIGLTTKDAFRIVEMTGGHGCEPWCLLAMRHDPQTDARLTSLILGHVNFKIKGKDVQAGFA